MTLLNEDMQILEDNWLKLGDESCIPINAEVIVSLKRLKQEAGTLFERKNKFGVMLDASNEVEEISAFLDKLGVVFLNFENFSDGRPFSQARLLRDRYRFAGHIRATGDVLSDQVSFMRRCGFDQFELSEDFEFERIKVAVKGLSQTYQKELSF